MSLQEALDRVEKLKRLMESSNPHEAALAESRLKNFNIDAARAPKSEETQLDEETTSEAVPEAIPEAVPEAGVADKQIEVLTEYPVQPHSPIATLEVHQEARQTRVNWDELHFALVEKARQAGADAIVDIQMKGNPKQKILAGIALKYLNTKDLFIDHVPTEAEIEEQEQEKLREEQERRDENTAPEID
ncbi:MAG: hypothetical protein IH977_01810 [Nitrospinae bacterium]|nr:hypothetical protein [Nitrospinota bacterium]